jgi:hypothetical protein
LLQHKSEYFIGINNYNNFCAKIEKDYLSNISIIVNKQEKKIEFTYDILKIFQKELINFGESNNEITNCVEKINKVMNIKRDVELFKDESNFLNEEKKRFALETFLDYDILRQNLEMKKNLNITPKKVFEVKKIPISAKQEEENKIEEQKIKNLIQKIFNEEENLDNDNTDFLMNYIGKDNNKDIKFISLLQEFIKNKNFLKINSLHNYNLFGNIIQMIIDGNSKNYEILYDKFLIIIDLGEKTIYDDKENVD